MKLFIAAFLFILHVFCATEDEISSNVDSVPSSLIVIVPPEPEEVKGNIDIVYNETINFVTTYSFNWNKFMELTTYRRTFKTTMNYRLVNVEFTFPYVGGTAKSTFRINLLLDDQIIYQHRLNQHTANILRTIHMAGHLTNVKPGFHTIKIYALAPSGYIYFPSFNSNSLENYFPALYAQLYVLGFN